MEQKSNKHDRPVNSLDVPGEQVEEKPNVQEVYNKSKSQDALFIKPAEWEKPGTNLTMLYIDAKIERVKMAKEQKELIERNELSAKMNIERQKWAKSLMSRLRKQFVEVNNFTKDSAEKRILALNNIKTQLAIHEKIQQASDLAREDLQELTDFRTNFAEHVKEYSWCREFMENIVADSDFGSQEECMSRVDGLLHANVELSEMTNEHLKQIEVMRLYMVESAKQAAATALGLSNKLFLLERDYRLAQQEVHKWEQRLYNAETVLNTCEINRERALDSIAHLYRLLCTRSGVYPKYTRGQLEEELDFIKDEVGVMNEVLLALKGRGFTTDEEQQGGHC